MGATLGVYILLVLLVIFIIIGRREWKNHLRNLKSVPVRIVVNGTRGKSSVTRLISAGLRVGGYKVMAKTTGTKPHMILNNQVEIPIIRLGKANIREQIGIFKKAVTEGVDTIVFENMSLRPDLQWIEENKLIQPTLVVITNVRADHLDVMGPTLKDIAQNFINAVPESAKVITAEQNYYTLMKELCEKKGINITRSNEAEISHENMNNFPYFEHRENVALAVEVCRQLGVKKEPALEEIYRSMPDPGVLRRYDLMINGKRIALYNALAANDPDSTYLIYERMEKTGSHIYLIVNCRSDRIDRSLQMGELIARKMPAELFFATGGHTAPFIRKAISLGVQKRKIIDLGGRNVEDVYERISSMIPDDSTIFAVGNIVGYGENLIKYFTAKGGRG